VRYVLDMHGVGSLQPWFNEDLKRRIQEKTGAQTSQSLFSHSTSGQPQVIAEMMGVSYLDPWQYSPDAKQFYANSTPVGNEVRSIAGYDYLWRFSLYKNAAGTGLIRIGTNRYELLWKDDAQSIELTDGRQPLVTLDMNPFLKRLQEQTAPGSNTGLPVELMTLEGESAVARLRLQFESLVGTRSGPIIQLQSTYGEALLKIKVRGAAE